MVINRGTESGKPHRSQGGSQVLAAKSTQRGSRWLARLRGTLRATHRDVGSVAVGLTLVYAMSGLAVNHIADWDANFRQVQRQYQVALPLPQEDALVARKVIEELSLDAPLRETYRLSDHEVELVFDRTTMRVDLNSGAIEESGQEPRFFLRLANWLHLNRGKKAWTYVADAYALALLWLAGSGLFMLPGRRGLWGRGGILAALGVAVPVAYVVLSGGP